MSNVLQTVNGTLANPSDAAWESKLDLIRRTVANGATGDELDLFLYQARRAGLDPLARQIYFVKRKGKGTIQVGIDGLRLIADRTGVYAGSDDPVFETGEGDKYPQKATVTVYKVVQGLRCAFTGSARWQEFYPGDEQGFQWRKMPHVMLGKCAEAIALRKAFPQDMSGLYVHEEMSQADSNLPVRRADPATGEVIEGEFVNEPIGVLNQPADAYEQDMRATAPPPERVQGEIQAAFGYAPDKWPFYKAFNEPATEKQIPKIIATWNEKAKGNEDDRRLACWLIVEAYGVGEAKDHSTKEFTKGQATLVIDWLMQANEAAWSQLWIAVDAFRGQSSMPLEPEDPYADE